MAENLQNQKPKKNLKLNNFEIPLISEDVLESVVFIVSLFIISFISNSLAPLTLSLFSLPFLAKRILEISGLKNLADSTSYFIAFILGFGSLLLAITRFLGLFSLDFISLRLLWVGALLLILFDLFIFYKKFGNIFKESSFWISFARGRMLLMFLIPLGFLMQVLELKVILDLIGTLIFAGFGMYLTFPKFIKNISNSATSQNSNHEEEEELDTGVKENEAIRRLGDLDKVVSVDHFETWFGEEYVVWGAARLVVMDTISQENLYITKIKAKKLLKSLGCQRMVVEVMYKSEEVV